MTKKTLILINKTAFVVLLITLIWTYNAKDNYRNIDTIHPDLLNEPIQTERLDKTPITFSKDNFDYELTPLYDYELNALIVSQRDYRWFSLSNYNNAFPIDLLVIWGENVRNKAYQSEYLSFSQDIRQGRWIYSREVPFNNNQAANEHLVINDEEIEKKVKSISTGDQVKIKGQLVNIKAVNTGVSDLENPSEISLNTSTVRNDEGPGACEIIYINDITILQKGHPFAFELFRISYYSIIILIFGNLIWFLIWIISNFISKPEEIL